MAPIQRFLIRRFLSGDQFLHTINAGPAKGLRYWITLPIDKAMWTGMYECDFALALAKAVRPGDVCMDIGGYRGFFSGVMALAGASKVIIFEPLPTNAEQIRQMIKLNPRLPIELLELAISDQIGVAKLSVMSETSMAKLSNSSFQKDQQEDHFVDVRLETLDHLKTLGRFPRADVIKIDVEGAEAMVLRGAEQLLRNDRPGLFIEIHSRELARECLDLLTQSGYSVTVLETNRPADPQSDPEICHFKALHPWES